MSQCKTVFVGDKGYCIYWSEIFQSKNSKYFFIEGPNIKIDKISYNLFKSYDTKHFVAVKKTGDIFALKPIQKKSEEKVPSNLEYQPSKKLGEGSYGSVSYFPTENIVVKKIKDTQLSQDTIKEIAIYMCLARLSCMPKMLGFDFDREITLQLERGVTTLGDAKLTKEEFKVVMFRLAKCMRQIASQGIINCDIKPNNIIISEKGKVQIIDWGLAEIDTSKGQIVKKNTHIQTLNYRSPEIMLYFEQKLHDDIAVYSNKVDIFSLGLVYYNIYTDSDRSSDTNTFQARTLLRILLDVPREGLRDRMSILLTLKKYVTGEISGQKEQIKKTLLAQGQADPDYFVPDLLADLLAGMLVFDPKERFTYDDIILHPYFQDMYRENVPVLPKFINNMPVIKNLKQEWTKGNVKYHMRAVTMEWMEEVCSEYNLSKNTLCLAFQLLDINLILTPNPKTTFLQLIACTSMLLASNLYDNNAPTIKNMIHISADTYTQKQMKDSMENTLYLCEGNILIPSLQTYCSANGTSVSSGKLRKFYLDEDMYTMPMPEFFNRKVLGIDKPVKNVDMFSLKVR